MHVYDRMIDIVELVWHDRFNNSACMMLKLAGYDKYCCLARFKLELNDNDNMSECCFAMPKSCINLVDIRMKLIGLDDDDDDDNNKNDFENKQTRFCER